MKLLRLSFLSLFIFLVAAPCFAQNNFTISGAVNDASNGEELIGAGITVNEMPGVGASSNAYGFYSLTLPKGTYTLNAHYLGFLDSSIIVSLDSNRRFNFRLSPATRQLNQVEITAHKNENLTKAQMGVIKMDVQEMNKIPVLFGERDILKTIQLLPGVKSAGEGNSGFYVRGGAADQNLILLDEAPIYNASHILGFFSTFNSDAIKDLTLYKGNMPAEYGGRLSSTVDIKMKDGNDKNYVIGGGIGLISSRLEVEGPIVKDKGSFMITGRRTYADLFIKLASDTNARKSILYFYDLNAKANYRFGKKDRVFLSGYFGRDKFGINNTSSFYINYGNITGTLRWNHIFSDKWFSNTSLILNDFDYTVGIDNANFNFKVRSVVLDYNLKEDLQFYINSKHTLQMGFLTTFHTVQPGNVTALDSSDLNRFSLVKKYGWENAIYIQHVWKPVKQVEINYGIRLSTFSVTGPSTYYTFDGEGNSIDSVTLKSGAFGKTYIHPEPRFAISYNFLPEHSIKMAYGRNTQNVHQLSNSFVGSPTDLWVLSSNNIQPEVADQVSLGYYFNFWKNHFEASVEGYYKSMLNQIDYKNGARLRANNLVESQLVYGAGRAYGVEFYLKMNVWKFSGWASYTLSRTERKFPDINNGGYYPAKQDRTHDLSLVLIYQVIPRLSLSATFIYYTGSAVTFPSGKYYVNGDLVSYYTERNGYRMPPYHRLDFALNYDLKTRKNYTHSLSISIYNVYARKNAYFIEFKPTTDPKDIAIEKTYLFRIVPAITYNFKFTFPQKKKQRMNNNVIMIIAICLMLTACQEKIDIALNNKSPKVVIEGNIGDYKGSAYVLVSQTTDYTDTTFFKGISGAQVAISDGLGNSDTLFEAIPGFYFDSLAVAVVGQSYHLQVLVNGISYEAVSQVPAPVPIDSLYLSHVGFDNDLKLVCSFNDPAGIANYYKAVILGFPPIQSGDDISNDQFTDGQKKTINLDVNIQSGDSIDVTLESIDKDVYQYFYTLRVNTSVQSASPANPASNITNGALGYFSAYSRVHKKYFFQ